MIIISLALMTNLSCVSDSKRSNTPQTVVVNKLIQEKARTYNYVFKSDSINICLSIFKNRHKQIEFNIKFSDNIKRFKIDGKANLILLEDDNGKSYVPQGTFILDSATNEEYLCDSTYSYNSDKISISFGFEKITNKRLSLVIYKSHISSIKDKEYTLYKNN